MIGILSRDVVALSRLKPTLIILEHTGGLVALFGVYMVARLRRIPYALDLHTSAYVPAVQPSRPFRAVQEFFVKRACLVMVHNKKSLELEVLHPRRTVVESRVPELPPPMGSTTELLRSSRSVVFITQFHADEPVETMVEAALLLGDTWQFFFTGNCEKWPRQLDLRGAENIKLTGFLNDRDYHDLLRRSAVLVVLTERDYTLVYGGREAVALEKPLVVSDNEVCKGYFVRGAVFAENEPRALAAAIREAFERRSDLGREMRALRGDLIEEYERQIERLRDALKEVCR